jgi:hypothetical protein
LRKRTRSEYAFLHYKGTRSNLSVLNNKVQLQNILTE